MPSSALKSWSPTQNENVTPGRSNRTPVSPQTSLLTPLQASEYLQVPVSTLAVWRCTGRVKLQFVKVGGRHVRYRQEDIEVFLAGQGRDVPRRPLKTIPSVRGDALEELVSGPLPETGYYREARYFRESHLRKWGKFVCETCSQTLQDDDAHVATCMDAPISDPHDTHCFCTLCHAELMKQARPKPPSPQAFRA